MKKKLIASIIIILVGFYSFGQNLSNGVTIDSSKIKIFKNTVYRAHQGKNTGNESDWLTSIRYSKILLLDVIFKKSKSEILSKSFKELNELSILLKDNPKIGLQIDGHTDKIGNSKLNLKLSKRRAKAIKIYLKKRGVKANRIVTNGYGDKFPVCESPCEKNRRVEFKFTQVKNKKVKK